MIILQAVGGDAMTGGFSRLVVLFVFLVLLFIVVSSIKSKKSSEIVLRRFNINPDGDTLVDIRGRNSGFISWLMSIMNLSPDAHLVVTPQEIKFKSGSISGEEHIVTSLKGGVASSNCKFRRPMGVLIVGIILALVLIGATMMYYLPGGVFLSIAVLVLFFLVYHFNKYIEIEIETKGGSKYGLKFKPSLIENVNVSMNTALEAIELINKQIVKLQSEK